MWLIKQKSSEERNAKANKTEAHIRRWAWDRNSLFVATYHRCIFVSHENELFFYWFARCVERRRSRCDELDSLSFLSLFFVCDTTDARTHKFIYHSRNQLFCRFRWAFLQWVFALSQFFCLLAVPSADVWVLFDCAHISTFNTCASAHPFVICTRLHHDKQFADFVIHVIRRESVIALNDFYRIFNVEWLSAVRSFRLGRNWIAITASDSVVCVCSFVVIQNKLCVAYLFMRTQYICIAYIRVSNTTHCIGKQLIPSVRWVLSADCWLTIMYSCIRLSHL